MSSIRSIGRSGDTRPSSAAVPIRMSVVFSRRTTESSSMASLTLEGSVCDCTRSDPTRPQHKKSPTTILIDIFIFILLPNLFHPKHEAASDSQVMPGSAFDAVVTVFGLHDPDTKPFLDSEVYTTAPRNNESVTECVESKAVAEIVFAFDTSSSGRGVPENGQPFVRTNGKLRPKSVRQCFYTPACKKTGASCHSTID